MGGPVRAVIYAYFMPYLNWRTAERQRESKRLSPRSRDLTRPAAKREKEIADFELRQSAEKEGKSEFHFGTSREGGS